MSGQWGNQMCIYCRFHQGPAMCYLEVLPGLPLSSSSLHTSLSVRAWAAWIQKKAFSKTKTSSWSQ